DTTSPGSGDRQWRVRVCSFCCELTRLTCPAGVLMSATISNNGCRASGGSSHARKHSTMVASTLIQRVPGMMTQVRRGIVGVKLAISRDRVFLLDNDDRRV